MEHVDLEALKQLLQKSLDGDKEAYKEFLFKTTKVLNQYFSKKIFHKPYIEDLIQETLISIHKAKHTYDPHMPILKWIHAIAYRRYIDFIRKNSRIKNFEISTETFTNFSSNIDYHSEEAYDNLNRINSLLTHMTEREKHIIRLLKIEKYSIKEAAKILHLSESALKVAAHRAYKKLKKLQKDYGL